MKIDRLIGILSILMQQNKVTASYLAEKFQVSCRTIHRDIDTLCQAGIPLVTSQGAGGGISVMDGYKLNSTLLTSGEMEAILTGLRSLDSVSGTNRYIQLMEKLSAGTSTLLSGGEHILIDLSSWSKAALAPKIELLYEAIETNRQATFHYFSPRGNSIRTIEPYYLIFHWANWYVWGYCRQRKDYRLFKVNRMTDLELAAAFCKRKAPLPDLSTERVFPGNFSVKAYISPQYRWRLTEEYGPGCFAEQEDGRLLFTFDFTDREAVLSWILSFGAGAELIEPQELRKELHTLGKKLQSLYQ